MFNCDHVRPKSVQRPLPGSSSDQTSDHVPDQKNPDRKSEPRTKIPTYLFYQIDVTSCQIVVRIVIFDQKARIRIFNFVRLFQRK